MNTKRQTIWLVSMLSLMVVLSAYYLFTDNVGEMDVADENEEISDTSLDAVEVDEHSDLTDLEEFEDVEGTEDQTMGDADTEGTDDPAVEQTDEDIIQKVQAGAQSGEELLAALDMKRTEELTIKTEQLMEIALDPKKSSQEIGDAEAQLRVIEETQAKVSDMEDQLMREYENVVISEESGKWNVVVQADRLQRSEAVTIIDMMMENLKVSPGKVAVEYVN